MYLGGSGNVSVSNTTIDTVALTASAYNGGIYRINGGLKVENSVIKNITGNNDEYCTGIYYQANANFEVSGLELQNIPGHGIYSRGSGIWSFSGITAVTGIGGEYSSGIYSSYTSNGSFSLTDSTFTSCGVYCSASGAAVHVTVTDTEIRNANRYNGLSVWTGGAAVTIERVTIDGVPNGTGINISSFNTVRVSNSTIRNCEGTGIDINNYSTNVEISGTTIENVRRGIDCSSSSLKISGCTIKNAMVMNNSGGGVSAACSSQLSIDNTTMELCRATHHGGAVSYSGNGGSITNSRFINCTAQDAGSLGQIISDASQFSIISGCEFIHDGNLPNMGASTNQYAISLFGHAGTFVDCTFTDLRSSMQGEKYLFNTWDQLPSLTGGGGGVYHYNRGLKLTLQGCTFKFSSGSAGLLALLGGQHTTDPDYLLMDGNTINDTNGQRPLIWLYGYNSNGATSGTFQFKANNTYNGTLLDTAAKVTALASGSGNVIRLTGDATPTLVP
jgi:hypothetical protein